MRNWMKQLNRVIVLALMLVCLFGYLGVEADAATYSGGTWTESTTYAGVYWYKITDTNYPKSGWHYVKSASNGPYYWYYFDSNGYMKTKYGGATTNGWLEVGGKWYHVDSNTSTSWVGGYGAMQTGWKSLSDSTGGPYWFYFETSGSDPSKDSLGSMVKGWQNREGLNSSTKNWYYFDSNGHMLTGWNDIGDATYYFNASGHRVSNAWEGAYWLGSDGKMATSTWVDNDNYYVGSDGKYLTGWQAIGGSIYFLNDGTVSGYASGQKLAGGWKTVGGYTYYFASGGQLMPGDSNGWLQIGSDWYMLNTTAASLETGLHSRMTEWVKVGDYWYYFDKSTGKMKTNSWVPSENGANDTNAYVDGEGKMVIGWKDIPADSGTWYYFNGSGKKQTNQIIWDPVQNWKSYYVDANGIMVKDTQITVSGTTYYADASGVLFPLDKKLNALNPYFDYVVGGLYGTSTNPIENRTYLTAKTETSAGYAIVKDQPIDLAYTELSIGAYPAKDGDLSVHIPNALRPEPADYLGWDNEGMDWVWDDAIDGAMAEAITENKSAIINSGSGDTEFIYAWYRNIATLNNRAVSLRMSIVDYGVVIGLGSPLISFNKVDGQPGIITAGIPWIQVKYELFYEGTNELIPATTKGNTSFYDVDNRQSICFSDNTNRGIYCSSSCNLKFGTVTQNGKLNGDCIFYDLDYSLDETDGNKPLYGFTEIFQGNTLIRTFSFENKGRYDPVVSNLDYPDGAASGAIYNYGDPLSSGKLKISKTVNPNTDTTEFTFKIKLTSDTQTIPSSMFFGAEGGVYSSVTFTNGEATVKLKHGQNVTIAGIPSGLKYTVTETANNAYQSASSGASGTIAANATKEAKFTNTRLQSLTVKKTVKGNMAEEGKTFAITVTIKKPDGTVFASETLNLAHDGSKTYNNIPAGSTYTIDEADYSGEGYTVAGEVSNVTLLENKTVTITNTQEERTLTVDKVVNGTDAAKDTEFTFTLNVWYADGTKYITDETFTLTDGSTPWSKVLPKNAKYTITEAANGDFITTVTDNGDGEETLSDNATVTFTNTELLDLTVAKQVSGETAETDRKFEFTVTYRKPNGDTGTENFSLAHGEQKIIPNLPYGTTYTVTEADDSGYTTTGEVTEATLTQDTTVTVTNTAKEHKLVVGKTVIGDGDAQAKEFTFTLVWARSGIGLDSENATTKTFTLKDGQTAEFVLPEGCTYQVTETKAEGYLDPVIAGNASVTGMTQDETVTFTNTQLVTLTLTKQVGGNMGNKEQPFEFTVKLGTGEMATAVNGTATFSDGVYTVSLAHDQSVVFTVPYDTAYEIKEKDYSEDGYETKIQGADEHGDDGYTATGMANGDVVTYKNTKGFSIPTGVDLMILPFLGMILLGAVVGTVQLLGGSRKSRRGRYLN